MSIPYINFTENIQKFSKYPKNSARTKLKPFRPILFSIFLYLIIFCVYRFSHSILPFTTKFWFFTANTLILIIAADFDAFTSSEKQGSISGRDHYATENNTRLAYMDVEYSVETTLMPPPDDKNYSAVSSATTDHEDHNQNLGPEATEEEIEQEDCNTQNPEEQSAEKPEDFIKTDGEVENEAESVSDQIEIRFGTRFGEEDEFSSMSVEELNTRVEEFIRKIHRQIRLQVVHNRQNLQL